MLVLKYQNASLSELLAAAPHLRSSLDPVKHSTIQRLPACHVEDLSSSWPALCDSLGGPALTLAHALAALRTPKFILS